MRKVIKQYQNNGKALEVRLEEDNNEKYYVVLAGTLNRQMGCTGGRCDPATEMESQTYMVDLFPNYNTAEQAFEVVRERYIEYHR